MIADYRILRRLGSGGMGTVYEAYEEKMRRNVALKVLSQHLAQGEKAAHRFALEAWIAGKLDHPNLVKVYEQGTWEDQSFYSMEVVEGGSLASVIKELRESGCDTRLGLTFGTRAFVEWAVRQIVTASRALDHAHHRGVVHRDVKPANILFSKVLGAVKVADFGLAIETDATRLTSDGAVVGTFAYMAPEQILGKKGVIDARADIYALGVTLFELLTLELPYKGTTQQLYLNAVLSSEARRARALNQKVSRDLEVVISKALEKDPRDRYATAGAFADDLENVLQFRPIVARPASPPSRVLKWARRRPMHAAVLFLLVVGIPTTAILSHRTLQHQKLLRRMRLEDLWSRVRFFSQRDAQRDVIATAGEILTIDPDHAQALRARAVASMRLAVATTDPVEKTGLQERALADLSRLQALLPRAAWPHRLGGYMLSVFGRPAEARDAEMRADRLRSEPPADDDLFFGGLLALNKGEPREAVRLFTELNVRRPDRPDAIGYRAQAYDSMGETAKAVEDYRLVAALNPDSFEALVSLGGVLTDAGNLDEGAAYLRRALGIDPGNPYGHENLSDNLYRSARKAAESGDQAGALRLLESAETEARTALRANAQLPWAHLNLGAVLMETHRLSGRPDTGLLHEAIEHFDRARALIGQGSERHDSQVRALSLSNTCDARIQLRDLERALDVCREASNSATSPDPYYNLAGVYALTGRVDEAFMALEKDYELGDRDDAYLSADPWFESLRKDRRFSALLGRMRKK